AFDVRTVYMANHNNYNIAMKQTGANTHTTIDYGGYTPVYSSAVETVAANTVHNIVLQTPFVWDGVSNIIIETCFTNSSWTSANQVAYQNVGYTASAFTYNDNSQVCANGGFG